jgi:hypothetical protein
VSALRAFLGLVIRQSCYSSMSEVPASARGSYGSGEAEAPLPDVLSSVELESRIGQDFAAVSKASTGDFRSRRLPTKGDVLD